MKKSLFMMGVAIAALSSCTQNEVLDIAESNTIQFGKSYIGKPTRANIINAESELENFYVYAKTSTDSWTSNTEDLFTNENVYRGPEGWGYDNLKIYENTKKYSFAAYSDGGNGTTTGKLDADVTFTAPTASSTAKLEIADYKTTNDNDLLVAISESVLAADQLEVQFAFKHALSQIKFTLHNPLGNNPIRVENFSVDGFKDNGTLTYQLLNDPVRSDIQWTGANSSNKTISGLALGDATTDNPAVGVFTVIPQTPQLLTVSFDATLYNAATDEKVGDTEQFSTNIDVATLLGNENYKPGFIYNFKMTLNMGYIYFDGITVDEWNEDVNENGTDDDIEVPATPTPEP